METMAAGEHISALETCKHMWRTGTTRTRAKRERRSPRFETSWQGLARRASPAWWQQSILRTTHIQLLVAMEPHRVEAMVEVQATRRA